MFFVILSVQGQFNSVNYDFETNAQSLQYNPGVKFPYNKLISIPFLSNISMFAGNTGFGLYDLFSPNGSFEQKFYNVSQKLKNTDFLVVNYHQDLFTFGWTDDLERFKYFGIYWEFDNFTNFPADLIRLGRDGNKPHLFEKYDLKYIATKTDFVQTIYYGVNLQPNDELTWGYRIKLYSGIFNVQSINNKGTFYTTDGQNNYYVHHLDGIDFQAKSSSFSDYPDKSDLLKKLFFSKNFGPGIDLGMTYHMSENMYFSASLLDLGFIYYSADVRNISEKGSYVFEGPKLNFDEGNSIDYWKAIRKDFKKHIVTEKNNKSYISFRPTSLYMGLKYGIGSLKKQDCKHFMNLINEHTSFLGLTGFAQYRPVKIHTGISVFYEQKWSKYFFTKVNVTADNYDYASVGAGIVMNFGSLQLYLAGDNLFGLSDLSVSHKQSINFGLNIIKY